MVQGTRVVLLACATCEDITTHKHAFAVPGNLNGKPPAGKLERPQEVLPVIEEMPTVVEQLWECRGCGRLRRWGLEVPDGEARGVRGAAKAPGGGSGRADVAELGG